MARHNIQAFEQLQRRLQLSPRALVLDSFCGTGHSTVTLAERHPDHLVVGIDKSGRRLQRHPPLRPDNCLLLQADCAATWQLLAARKLAVDYHYLLYPNPWPKARHLQRRIHGHASFPLLLQLAASGRPGRLQLRSNWQTYVEEFGVALHLAGVRGSVSRVSAAQALTLFEQKYRDSGHSLWQLSADGGRATP